MGYGILFGSLISFRNSTFDSSITSFFGFLAKPLNKQQH